MYSSVLVTGGAGFVGSSLAIALRNRLVSPPRVFALDNLRRRGSDLNLKRLAGAGVEFIHGDVRSNEDFAALPCSPELIIECSAEPSVQAGYRGSPEYLIQTNLTGCFHCLELARRTRADFLFLSTSRVYPFAALNELRYSEEETRYQPCSDQVIPGASERGIDETFPMHGARSLYGMTKLAAELMIQEYADAFGIRYIVNRCGLIAGPWQMAKSDQGVFALWVAAHYFRQELRYIGFQGSGKQVRDLLHIDDLCDLLLMQVENFQAYRGRQFNVGGGAQNTLSLREATMLCQDITGNPLTIRASDEVRKADVRIYISDSTLASSVEGWRARRDARSTLADIYAWIRSEEAILRTLFTDGVQLSGIEQQT